LTKIRIGPVFTAYLLKCALPLGSIKALGEDAALAALVAVPQIGGGIVVDHPGDIDRECVDRIDAVSRRSILAPRRFAGRGLHRGLALVARGAGEQFGKPTAIACLAIVLAARDRTECRRTGPPRRRPG
jgi:hypothetical protein